MTLRVLMLALAALSATAQAAPPLTAYGQLPEVSDVTVSPDGKAFAAMVGLSDERAVQLRGLPDLQLLTRYRTGDAKVRSLRWAGPDHLVLTVSTTSKARGIEGGRREWYLALEYNLKTRKWSRLLDMAPNAMNVVLGSPVALSDDARDAIGIEGLGLKSNLMVPTLFRINLDSHIAQQLDVGSAATADWVIGPDGHGVARADYRQTTGEWTLFVRESDGQLFKRTRTIVAPVDPPQLLGYGRDTGHVLVSMAGDDGWQRYEVSLADGSWSAPIEGLDGDALLRDRATRTVLATLTTGMTGYSYQFVDPADQKLWVALEKAFPGEVVSFVDWSDDRMVAVVEVEGAKSGDAFFLVDRRTRKAEWLADRYHGVGADAVNEQQVIRYKAADGLEIPAYLTLPRSRPARALPLIVLPHGGPADRDYPGFDWWAQALASRGYAVLQPQFRGSDGFGDAHLAAGYGELGRKMQTDLSDGVRHLAATGMIDPARVCIVGASYGGYAALAGVTFDPGLYRCAAAVAGIADLRRMLQDKSKGSYGARTEAVRYWQRFMGAASPADTSIDRWSPALQASVIKAPVLLIHGKDDTVVPYVQSTLMADAMKTTGGRVEFITLEGEDHWLSRGQTRQQMLDAMVSFLEKHNPPGPAGAAQ